MQTSDPTPMLPPVGEAWERAKAEKNWLLYRLVEQPGKKPKKIPQSAAGRNVSPKVAACLSFDDAHQLATRFGAGYGTGYLPRAESAMVCIDFDGVLKGGIVQQEDFPSFTSYGERSPSGTGLHVLVIRPTDIAPTTFDDGEDWVGYIGSDSKFFTVSMDRWGQNTEVVEDRALVEWVFQRRTGRAIGEARPRSEPRLTAAQQERLRSLHLTDRANFWFFKLPPAARAECARQMLAVLPKKFARSYDTWIKVGMALKLAEERLELFPVWDEWSATASNYDGKTEAKWDTFADGLGDRPVSTTVRTVISWAKQHGWDPAPWEEAASMQDNLQANAGNAMIDARMLISNDADFDVMETPAGEETNPSFNAGFVPDHLTRPGGLLEALVDYGASICPRETRLPALAGALAATSALTVRRYMIVTPGFLTSPGLQVVLVGETGTGKETARDVVYAICGLQNEIAIAESYASSPALHLALNSAPTQLWANDEFGRYMKVAANANGGGAHDFGLITMAMKLHTMFGKYLPQRVYSQGASRDRVDHPLLVAMHTTTPKALFDALNADAVVDGMLGRLLVIHQPGRPQLKSLGSKSSDPVPAEIKSKITRLESFIVQIKASRLMAGLEGADDAALISLASPGLLPGQNGHWFIPIEAGDETVALFEPIRMECERRANGTPVKAALWSRAYEQILRLAGVAAFGQAVWDENPVHPAISIQNLTWAKDLVYWSLDALVPAAEEHAADGERDALQKAILAALGKLSTPAQPDGWVRKQHLLKSIQGRGRTYREVKDEITALIECGDVVLKVGDDGIPVRPEMVRLVR